MAKTRIILTGVVTVLFFVPSNLFAQNSPLPDSDAAITRALERIENEVRELRSQVRKRSGYYRPVSFEELGITVAIVPLNGMADPFDKTPYRFGLRVEKMTAQLEADKMHLAVGDTIVRFEETRVESNNQLSDAMNRAIKEKTRFPAMLIVRDNEIRVARLGEP